MLSAELEPRTSEFHVRHPVNYSEGDRTWGFAVLRSVGQFFVCGIPVNKIPHCGIAVISKPTVCNVCAFKPTVSGKTKLFAVLGNQQSVNTAYTRTMR